MKIAFCQIPNILINPVQDQYAENIYAKVPGYKKGADFWEIPLWIAKASHCIPEGELYIVRDIEQAVKDLSEFDAVMFSVLEVNKEIIKRIIENLPANTKFVLGGYINSDYFKCFQMFLHSYDVTWLDTLQAGIEYLGYEYHEGVSYKLFKGTPTIPRLSLSDGCLYNCKFCCVEKTIKEYSFLDIMAQTFGMTDLDFEPVYINDKTFGQAKNHTKLPEIYRKIKTQNPNFKGFIIQTTATNFLKLSPEVLACIAYVELGIESFNDDILKAMDKPHREKNIVDACWKIFAENLKGNNIKLVPNILVSLPGENDFTYNRTLNFLEDHSEIISHVNIYLLAIYDNTKLSAELDHNESDKNENSLNKSWSDNKTGNWFYSGVIKFANNQIDKG